MIAEWNEEPQPSSSFPPMLMNQGVTYKFVQVNPETTGDELTAFYIPNSVIFVDLGKSTNMLELLLARAWDLVPLEWIEY